MSNKVLCIDFDGTLVEHAFPLIGEPMPGAFEVLKELKAAGYRLILWTCREDDHRRQYLREAVRFCKENGVEFDAVNETIQEEEFRSDGVELRKPYCRYFIDDRNLGGFPGWDVVRKVLLEGCALDWKLIE
jgi:hydroxymethylpyrimidine pyrophosphatase-like HAD family hydrolase